MADQSRILVPIDFSDPSRKALAYGVAVAKVAGAKLFLAHILPGSYEATSLPDSPAGLEKRRIENAQHSLNNMMPAGSDAVHYEMVVKLGDVQTELLNLVRDEKVDLIIMGSRGRSGLGRRLLGSVTEHMLREVRVPVLTISHVPLERAAVQVGFPAVRRILYATDLGPAVANGLKKSVELAAYFKATLTIVHVVWKRRMKEKEAMPAAVFVGAGAHKVIAQLDDLTRPHLDAVQIRTVVLQGDPHKAILRFADDNRVSLIVLDLRRKSRVRRMLLGATAEQVVRMAEVPVLSVPFEAS